MCGLGPVSTESQNQRSGLGDRVGIDHRLDLMGLEGFPSPDDYGIMLKNMSFAEFHHLLIDTLIAFFLLVDQVVLSVGLRCNF